MWSPEFRARTFDPLVGDRESWLHVAYPSFNGIHDLRRDCTRHFHYRISFLRVFDARIEWSRLWSNFFFFLPYVWVFIKDRIWILYWDENNDQSVNGWDILICITSRIDDLIEDTSAIFKLQSSFDTPWIWYWDIISVRTVRVYFLYQWFLDRIFHNFFNFEILNLLLDFSNLFLLLQIIAIFLKCISFSVCAFCSFFDLWKKKLFVILEFILDFSKI